MYINSICYRFDIYFELYLRHQFPRLKRISAILFLFSFLIMSFSKNIVILNFFVNRGAIAEKYCVNKYKPSLHCNGHCFLMKQIKKEQQRETKDMGDQMSKLEIVSFKNYFPELKPELYEVVVKSTTSNYYNCAYTKDISLLVFKPPRA